ncbi:hypothetical protein BJX63DRAFT_427214 [Aspergillus granulosus]|uniref:Uncharacterized protein n=1 Tax=Aspergillus granulosus TaxID=176169 RepID=A0ABR4I6Q9_9EURO
MNFTKLLKTIGPVLRNVIKEFKISFTAPTSYWYLRHFHLKATAEAVDYINIIAYNLHRIWDSENPIGSQYIISISYNKLHKRWFGSDVIDWLRRLIGTVENFGHSYTKKFVLKLVDKQLTCPNFKAHLNIHAETTVHAELSYRFTIIAKLNTPINFSQSFLYFRTRRKVEAEFVVGREVTYHYNTNKVLLLAADKLAQHSQYQTQVKLKGWDIQAYDHLRRPNLSDCEICGSVEFSDGCRLKVDYVSRCTGASSCLLDVSPQVLGNITIPYGGSSAAPIEVAASGSGSSSSAGVFASVAVTGVF